MMFRKLDPIPTNWIIITGPPCSGKTTVINKLAERGFTTKDEEARKVISELKQQNLSPEKLTEAILSEATHQEILNKRIAAEKSFSPETCVAFDRGAPDSFAYYELNKHDVTKAQELAKSHLNKFRYKCVFLFEALPLIKDGVRYESDPEREKLQRMFFHYYSQYGYRPILVPAKMSIDERINFMMHQIKMIDAKKEIQKYTKESKDETKSAPLACNF